MGIISDIVDNVNSVKILAVPSKNGKRQLTVYSNTVITPNSNVLCLPVPNPRSVRLEYVPRDIFSQCKKSFNIHKRCGSIDSFSTLFHTSYEVIVVNSINELNNQNGFILTATVIDFLKVFYPSNFGFILCKLKKGNITYKPLAYSHDIKNKLFFPTKYYHSTIHYEQLPSSFDYINLEPNRKNSTDSWDHELYSIATPIGGHESSRKIIQNTNKIKWSKMPRDFQLDSFVNLRCYEKVGYYPNVDIEMHLQISMIY